MDEIKLLENQLKRMRSMNRFYHLQFLNDVRYFFVIGLISLIISFNSDKTLYLLPLIALFGSVILAFHAYYLIFSRNYSEYIEKKINKTLNKDAYIYSRVCTIPFPWDILRQIPFRQDLDLYVFRLQPYRRVFGHNRMYTYVCDMQGISLK